MNMVPGYQNQDDPTCQDPSCEFLPERHGKSHLPTTFVLVVNGPGYAAQFRVGASYLDEEALGAVFADLHMHVWRDWCRLTKRPS